MFLLYDYSCKYQTFFLLVRPDLISDSFETSLRVIAVRGSDRRIKRSIAAKSRSPGQLYILTMTNVHACTCTCVGGRARSCVSKFRDNNRTAHLPFNVPLLNARPPPRSPPSPSYSLTLSLFLSSLQL